MAALHRLRASGRRLLLVTGRELPDLQEVFPHLELFDRVVVENGALIYCPETKQERLLCEAPAPEFVERLRAKQVQPLSVGRAIVATWEPHQTVVLDSIRELGLELHVIFNKGAVMVLPSGVNKETGLRAALQELGLSTHNVAGIGDAENDHAFLRACEVAAAVENALPALKERCDLITQGARGEGVAELIDMLLADDLVSIEPRLQHQAILLGRDESGAEVGIPPLRGNVIFAGPSGSGKSTAATGVFERLLERGYQLCIVDPEGDYQNFAGAVVLGDTSRSPSADEVMQVLSDPAENVVVNLLGIPLADRPTFFAGLFARVQELRSRSGRPHWLVIDEAHHLLPPEWVPATSTLPQELNGLMMITVHPENVSRSVLEPVSVAVAVGSGGEETLRWLAEATMSRLPQSDVRELEPGEILAWFRERGEVLRLRAVPGEIERRRHVRKYAEGELPPDRSFYFRGPEGKLNLRAQNLMLFVQLAEGVDDATWEHHLRRGDYSKWIRDFVKDVDLAAEVASVEQQYGDARQARQAIREAIEKRYTAAA